MEVNVFPNFERNIYLTLFSMRNLTWRLRTVCLKLVHGEGASPEWPPVTTGLICSTALLRIWQRISR